MSESDESEDESEDESDESKDEVKWTWMGSDIVVCCPLIIKIKRRKRNNSPWVSDAKPHSIVLSVKPECLEKLYNLITTLFNLLEGPDGEVAQKID